MTHKILDTSRCGVIGYGSWATALVHTLQKNMIEVWWHVTNEEILESLEAEGRNAKYLNDIEFDTALLHPSSSIDEVVKNCEIVLIASPSAFLKDTMSGLHETLEGKFILSATKGIIPGDYTTITEFFNQRFSIPYSNLGVMRK